jgi:hypothetical protein
LAAITAKTAHAAGPCAVSSPMATY